MGIAHRRFEITISNIDPNTHDMIFKKFLINPLPRRRFSVVRNTHTQKAEERRKFETKSCLDFHLPPFL
jgi:hypothetical protein